ncbi:STAS domain-containing protein [Nocardia brasiliensis]|nr:STAS domain-containing protein [Nocardia brasiliensis]
MSSSDDARAAAAPPDRSAEVADLLRFSVFRPRPDIAMMMVYGQIDLWTAPSFREQLARLISARSTLIVIDLSPVTFLSAAGLRVLFDAQMHLEKTCRRMVLITRARCVDRPIEVTGLAPSFHRVPSLDAVLADRGVGYEETA